MKNRLFYTLLLLVFSLGVWADAPQYPITSINPLLLLSNPNSIVRKNEVLLNINGPQQAKTSYVVAITIFNEKAERDVVIWHDKFTKVSDIEAILYDADGKQIRRLKGKDIEDSAVFGQSLVSDDYAYHFNMFHETYPYTLLYQYTVTHKGFLNFLWYPYTDDSQQAVETASYKVIFDEKNNQLHHYAANTDKQPSISTIGDKTIWYWQFENLLPTKDEVFNGNIWQHLPSITIVPQRFSLDGHEGSNETWQSYGQWAGQLWQGLDQLQPEAQAEIRQLIQPNMTETDKIKAIYKYVQQRSRYVSIQLGIGGWQPFEASFVHKNKYGDCKALTNYTKAALKVVDIESFPALINVDIDNPDFYKKPQHHFNHVILCVPTQKKDTIWLECTDSHLAANSLHNNRRFQCADKHVLLLTHEGSILAKTPISNHKHNQQHLKVQLQPTQNGSSNVQIQLTSLGTEKNSLLHLTEITNNKELSDALQAQWETPNFTLLEANFSQADTRTDTFKAQIKGRFDKKSNTNNSKRIFANMAVLSVGNTYTLPPLKDKMPRKQAIYLFEVFDNTLEVRMSIDSTWTIESMPDKVNLQTDFGSYMQTYTFDETQKMIVLQCQMSMRQPIIAAEQYNALKDFYDKINKCRQQPVVLVKE